MARRFLLLAALAGPGCKMTDRTFLDRADRVRQRDAEYDASGVKPLLEDRAVDRALMEQQDNRR